MAAMIGYQGDVCGESAVGPHMFCINHMMHGEAHSGI